MACEPGLDGVGERRLQLDPKCLARLRSRRPQPDAPALLVVVADEGALDRRDARPDQSNGALSLLFTGAAFSENEPGAVSVLSKEVACERRGDASGEEAPSFVTRRR
jgi:hypothetical protein